MRFHHVGYATANIDRFVEDFFRPVFAPLAISDKISDPIQRVTVCFARMQGDTLIDLVEPLGENSPVDAVIGSSRGGVYHLCYEVEDLSRELARLRQKRCMPVSKPVPAAAFNGRRVVFLLTPQRDLIELVEKGQDA
jgi:methylmalonyl-CoA/ethylmalonyl-CoA epimerase